MIKFIQHFAEADPARVLVALDLRAAFQSVFKQHDPELATVFSGWYTGSTTHCMHYEDSHAHVHASSGIDQGCPLSPCGFAATVESVSRFILSETRNGIDEGAKLAALPC